MVTLREHLEAIRDQRNRPYAGADYNAFVAYCASVTHHAEAALTILADGLVPYSDSPLWREDLERQVAALKARIANLESHP